MRYWLDTFNEETWAEFVAAGSQISGFPENRLKTVDRMQVGDMLVCYVTGKKVFNAVLKVVGKPRMDTKRIWKKDIYPVRIPVKLCNTVPIENGVILESLRDHLTWFHDLKHPSAWTYRVRNTPYEIRERDAKTIIDAIHKVSDSVNRVDPSPCANTSHESTHEYIQWLLLSFGNDMGLDVWVARNDRHKSHEGKKFTDLPRILKSLPVQFGAKAQKTIELIDVLWLRGNSIIAAFEIEHTTSVYSGLLRMSDLTTLQPNIDIRLFIVAPDERREKVESEINRPTFARAKLPRFFRSISYSKLTDKISQAKAGGFLRYLNPSFLDEISEK